MKKIILYLFVLSACLHSCKKEDTQAPSLHDGKSTVIEDLAGDTGASMSNGADGKDQRPFYIFLFRLKDQRQIWIRNATDSATYLKAADWDLAFGGIYNSSIFSNNGNYSDNPAFGGMGASAIVVLDKPYAQVEEAPADAVFDSSTVSVISQELGRGTGWFNYNTSTHLMQPVKSRTFVLKLNNGKYAKLELINIYKGNPPAVTDLNWPAPYFTFRYYVQEDGSRSLKTN